MDFGKAPWEFLTDKQIQSLRKLHLQVGLKEALRILDEKKTATNQEEIQRSKNYLIWWAGTPVIMKPCTDHSYISWKI